MSGSERPESLARSGSEEELREEAPRRSSEKRLREEP
jgi:hypothetical protein